MLKGTRRNLSTGYKSLSNIGFSSGNFFVNYIYFFLVLLIMTIIHLIVSLMKLLCSRKDPKSKWKRCIYWMKRGFEFSWYLNLFIFASLFIFILSINDMAGRDTSTGLNIFSFILSIIFFILMIVLMLFPLLLLCKQQTKLLEISQDKDNLKGFFSKLTYNYMKGLKLTRGARLYNFVFILRRLILAILIVWADNKTTQLVIFILLNVGFTIYMIVIRPFVYKTQNFIGIFNEIILLVCCFLMFAFFDTGSVKTGVGILMIVLFSTNIIIWFSVSFLFEIYLYCRRRKFNSIEVVKGGEIVKYHTQKPVDEPSYIKDESESRTNKNVLPLINPSIIQPDIPNEDFKINDESRDLGI